MTPNRKVLRVITRLNIGGPALQALMLTRELRHDYPTKLIAGEPEDREGELGDPSVAVDRAPLIRPVRPAQDIAAFRSLKRVIARYGPGLVHTHMAKAGFIGRLAALTEDRAPILVHTFHGHVLEGYFGSIAQTAFRQLERALAKRTHALITVSPEIRESLLAMGIGDEARFHVIELGFVLDPLLGIEHRNGSLRSSLGLDQEVPVIAVLGRLAPIKDHATLLRAMTKVEGAHLAVLGDGELRPELERLAELLGIGHRVHFLGWWRDVASALADVDVVALTSRSEGTPVSLIEASAAALPVVATDVGGVRHVVQDRTTGFLVPAGDARGVATRLEELIRDPQLRRSLGQAGRAEVRDRFSYKRLLGDIRALYDDLINERAARASGERV